jgi:hypothetical protein
LLISILKPKKQTMQKLLIAAFSVLLFLASCKNPSQQKEIKIKNNVINSNTSKDLESILKPVTVSKIKTPKKKVITLNNIKSTKTSLYSLRKYNNVTLFYSRIAKSATELSIKNNVPPAVILAIAGLESGWNQGYIGRITGNILSLGKRGGDIELPPLKIARLNATNKILFDSLEIIKYATKDITWEERPPSLKKDYRPKRFAGKPHNLAYFKYHPKEKAKAQIKNINDFVTIFISRKSRIKAYRKGRNLMDSLVKRHGKEILLEEATAVKFIHEIGGKLNSFNFRKTWPKKVLNIIEKAGLSELTAEFYSKNAEFKDVW